MTEALYLLGEATPDLQAFALSNDYELTPVTPDNFPTRKMIILNSGGIKMIWEKLEAFQIAVGLHALRSRPFIYLIGAGETAFVHLMPILMSQYVAGTVHASDISLLPKLLCPRQLTEDWDLIAKHVNLKKEYEAELDGKHYQPHPLDHFEIPPEQRAHLDECPLVCKPTAYTYLNAQQKNREQPHRRQVVIAFADPVFGSPFAANPMNSIFGSYGGFGMMGLDPLTDALGALIFGAADPWGTDPDARFRGFPYGDDLGRRPGGGPHR
ncbi:MAG TPA: hypothetical protein VG965_04330 [Patescibacteria group bacterium]|nr:hypothetical protein [Patescibacteria group bacterium]